MNKIVIVKSDDWQGLYVNGELEEEAHEIQISEIGEFTPIIEIKEVYLNDYGCEELKDFACLPELISHIPSDWYDDESMEDDE